MINSYGQKYKITNFSKIISHFLTIYMRFTCFLPLMRKGTHCYWARLTGCFDAITDWRQPRKKAPANLQMPSFFGVDNRARTDDP